MHIKFHKISTLSKSFTRNLVQAEGFPYPANKIAGLEYWIILF